MSIFIERLLERLQAHETAWSEEDRAVAAEAEAILHPAATAAAPSEWMETVILSRAGDAPLKFRGELLTYNEDRYPGGEQNRWWRLAVYRTEGKRLVVAVGYRTCWAAEADSDFAAPATDPSCVATLFREALETLIPNAIGYPPGEAYANRQIAMLQSLRCNFEQQMSEIFKELPECAEQIE